MDPISHFIRKTLLTWIMGDVTENTLSEDSNSAYPDTNLVATTERKLGIPNVSSEASWAWARRGYISEDHVKTPRADICIITLSGVI